MCRKDSRFQIIFPQSSLSSSGFICTQKKSWAARHDESWRCFFCFVVSETCCCEILFSPHSHFTFSSSFRALESCSFLAVHRKASKQGFDFTLNWRFSLRSLARVRFSHDLFSLVHSVHEQMKSGRAGAWHTQIAQCVSCKMWGNMMSTFSSSFFVVYVRWYEIWGSEHSTLSCAAARERRRKIDLKCFWDNLTQ